mgnify:FL=1
MRFLKMNKLGLILMTLICLSGRLTLASEEFDPALFPEEAAAEAAAGEQGGMTPYPAVPVEAPGIAITPGVSGGFLASPKFVDDEEMNFDNITSALGEEETAPAAIPMIQPHDMAAPAPKTGETADSSADTEIRVDKNQSLTENLKESDPADIKLPVPDVKGTWINKLKSPLKAQTESGPSLSSDANLESLVEKSRRANRRSNASVFDISGAMLRMTFRQIDETLTRRGYKRIMQKMDIPNFIRWRNEDKCRASGVIGYERLANCVVKIAKRDKHEYVVRAGYAKYDTKESIEVSFTSNFTNNKAYKIFYKSEAANIRGNSQKAIYLRNIKVYDFWKKINQKYGNPDNRDDVVWGLGGNNPYLQAATGRLLLEDPMLRELDYTRMSREDQRFMNTDLYSF